MEQIGLIIFGAFIAGIVSYWFNIKQDKKNAKDELRFKASEELLTAIQSFNNSLSALNGSILNYIFNIEQYNQSLDNLRVKNAIPQSAGNVSVVNIEDSFVKLYSDNIVKNIEGHSAKWSEYSSAFNTLWYTFESRQVILNEFTNMYKFMLKEFDKLLKKESDFIWNYYNLISPELMSKNKISENDLNNTRELYNRYQTEILDMQCYLYDFKVELQNNYLSKLFDYKIPRRQPKQEGLIVLTKDIEVEESD